MVRTIFFAISIAVACSPEKSNTSDAGCPHGDPLLNAETGPSGLRDAPLGMLTEADWSSFCAWALPEEGGAGHVFVCGGGMTVTIDTQAECAANGAQYQCCPDVLVSDAEACVLALHDDPCSAPRPPDECAAMFSCRRASLEWPGAGP